MASSPSPSTISTSPMKNRPKRNWRSEASSKVSKQNQHLQEMAMATTTWARRPWTRSRRSWTRLPGTYSSPGTALWPGGRQGTCFRSTPQAWNSWRRSWPRTMRPMHTWWTRPEQSLRGLRRPSPRSATSRAERGPGTRTTSTRTRRRG
eukprot:5325834-Heterocapsa_arctica.AAC.1